MVDEELNNINLLADLDVYGTSSDTGQAILHKEDLAISNGIILFLNSHLGDFLFEPEEGGFLTEILFKPATEDYLHRKQTELENFLVTTYSNYLSEVDARIQIVETNRLLIDIIWRNIDTLLDNRLQFYMNQNPSRNSSGSLSDSDKILVEYTDDNLIAFIDFSIEEQPNAKLLLNHVTNQYEWGKYIFVNLKADSDRFSDILALIG